ncbi:hypothetical protein IW967_12335 [Alicyclobacillus mali]|uniref:Uncharacterized protein n=1 Tax=Alicyclobacillus mali (ex Roth et al. 2021) TaxID=1123961 RepID=A0ABS0F5S4_9BACL|nr:hypothetical protein [Alicyclobacillus mali (ex Roth et al. 2021)]MBF8378643.1 hypothetical protein [Alicyclobacillus mali (ex Roth et al. 2021)]MCL6490000.1 hypothetical protein [Alicyclobacillus mali (ex Roth et al. 2021)]
MKLKRMTGLCFVAGLGLVAGCPIVAADDNSALEPQGTYVPHTNTSQTLTLPGAEGTLTANVWRSSYVAQTGNALTWDWQVSAVYAGPRSVEWIRTQWYSQADLRNGASISMGVSGDSASASYSSSWQTVRTPSKYWTNNNGAKESDYRGNLVIGPAVDYRQGSIVTVNTASVKLAGDPKTYTISAGV